MCNRKAVATSERVCLGGGGECDGCALLTLYGQPPARNVMGVSLVRLACALALRFRVCRCLGRSSNLAPPRLLVFASALRRCAQLWVYRQWMKAGVRRASGVFVRCRRHKASPDIRH